MRQNINQRNQQDNFSVNRKKQRGFRIADGNKRLLAGNLNPHNNARCHENAQCPGSIIQKSTILCKQRGKQAGKEHHNQPQRRRIAQRAFQQNGEGFAHALRLSCPEVIACNRLCALRKPRKRQHGKLHHACQNRHRTNRSISAVFQQRGIKADIQNTFRRLHHKVA